MVSILKRASEPYVTKNHAHQWSSQLGREVIKLAYKAKLKISMQPKSASNDSEVAG